MSRRKKMKSVAVQLVTAYQGRRKIDHLLRKGLMSPADKPRVSDAVKRAKEINEGETK